MPKNRAALEIPVEVDAKEAEQDLARLKKEIRKTAEEISAMDAKRSPLVQQAEELAAKIKAARAEAERYRAEWVGGVAGADQQQAKALALAQQLEVEHAGVVEQIDKIDRKWLPACEKLEKARAEAGGIEKELNAARIQANGLGNATAAAEKKTSKFALRMREVVRSALVFTVISQGLAAFRGWLGRVIKSNDQAVASVARLKGALLTLTQPLLEVLIPAFVVLVDLLTHMAAAVADVVSMLFGTAAEESAAAAEALNDETKALDKTGNAAKKAGKSLASFDEINRLSGGAGGGGSDNSTSTGQEIAPDFGFLDVVDERLSGIADDVLLIGVGFGLWKLSDILPGKLGDLAVKLAGIALTIGGLKLMWDGLVNAWENGLDWGSLIEIIGGAAAAVIGLAMAFGEVGAGIGSVVTGGAMIVTAFQDIIKNGANLKNTLLLIAGLVAAGLGFFVLTGSVVPLVIAAVLSVITAILALSGNLQEFVINLKENIFGGIAKFVKGVFTYDWRMALEGLADIFRGVLNGVAIYWEGVINLIIKGLNWLISKINTLQIDVPEIFGGGTIGINIPPIDEFHLPRLATGAIIPPNREFMAVLGDQKSGYNIEAPEALIRRIVREETANNQSGGAQTIILECDKVQFAKLVYRLNQAEGKRRGVSLAGV